MAVNHNSGRVVVDIDPQLKLALHAALLSEGTSLKDWFVRHAEEHVGAHWRSGLVSDVERVPFGTRRKEG